MIYAHKMRTRNANPRNITQAVTTGVVSNIYGDKDENRIRKRILNVKFLRFD